MKERNALFVPPRGGREYLMGPLSSLFVADGSETDEKYAISEWWLEPNTKGPGVHSHEEDDAFFVLEGTMSFFLQDRWLDAPKGSFVLAPGGMHHDFANRSTARAGMLNVSVPGTFEQHMPAIAEWFRERSPEDSVVTDAPNGAVRANVTPVPEGQKTFSYLVVRGAADAIAFYERAFGAKEKYRLEHQGKIGHAEISLPSGVDVWLADDFPEQGFCGPDGPTPVSIVVYVEDVDVVAKRAIAAGAKLERPIRDEFYGDRVAALVDPFGHRWLIHSRREVVTPEQMRARMSAGA